MGEQTYTLREAADILRVHVETARRYVLTGTLKAFRTGPGPSGRLRIRSADLEAYMTSRVVTAAK